MTAIEDLEHRLDYVVAERERLSGIAKRNLNDEFILAGSLASSGAMLAKEELARDQLDEVMPVLVADVDRARQGGVAEPDLRAALDNAAARVVRMLRVTFTEVPNPAFREPSYGARLEFLDGLERRAQSQVRQYWAGYLTPNAPPGSYSLTVTGSPGAAVQVGGAGNTQTVTNTTINYAAAQVAAAGLASALATLPASEARNEAEADLASLQRHLAKPDPQSGLIKELGKAVKAGVGKLLSGFASEAGKTAASELFEILDII